MDTFEEYAERHGVKLEEANGEEDHMHFLFRAPPNNRSFFFHQCFENSDESSSA
ncbi:MAG: transposase [Candidatus Hodarchaeales archaeon]